MRALIKAFIAMIVIAATVALAVLLADQPGRVTVVWRGMQMTMGVGLLVGAVIIAALLITALFLCIRFLLRSPKTLLRVRRERRRRAGYRALTQGMVAVAAGDPDEAQHLARKADLLLAEPPLTLLLSAQAAQLKGDEQAAHRYFTAMLDRAETEFLGLRGLIMHALRRGDDAHALRLAERARTLRPKTPWVLSCVFELQARAGRWRDADQSLAEAGRRKALPKPMAAHQRAVVHHEKSRQAEAEGLPRDALTHAARAHALDPSFAPAAVRYAEMLRIAGKRRHAAKVIETAWRAAPHQDLAAAYETLFADEPPLERMRRIEQLAALRAEHAESKVARAAAALKAGIWGEARRHLHTAGATAGGSDERLLSPRICRLMAELEEAEHGDPNAGRAWLARAATTTAADPAYVCSRCGAASAQWSAVCPSCRSFDSLAWRTPGERPPAIVQRPGDLAPPLPVPTPWPLVDAQTRQG